MMYRINLWNQEHGIVDKLQGALQEKCSSLNTAWIVKGTVCANIDDGKSVYVGL